MGRRILAVLAALLALFWAAVPAYAASPAVDSAYLTREPWQNVPVTEFRADGAMGYYQIYADTDNHCLYFAVVTGASGGEYRRRCAEFAGVLCQILH